MSKKVLIAMSGGVDSSAAALLVLQQGMDAAGATMKLFDNEDINVCKSKVCCSLDDVQDARSVAAALNMPHYVLNLKESFMEQVVKRFVDAYEAGLTPNPCIDCNRYIKFSLFLQRAQELGFDSMATGHYAQIEFDGSSGRYLLKKAVDLSKDQSYVLYNLTQEQLSKTLLPLGGMLKEQVRALAQEKGFVNAKKHDSQDICFVPDGDYAAFIEKYTGKTYPPGDFVDKVSNVLGEHKGLIRYTIGQRKGLGISHETPLYVCSKCIEKNTVLLGSNDELFTKQLDVRDINMVAVPELKAPLRAKAKVRYKHTEQPATIWQTGKDSLHVEFDEPQRAITSGQALVIYDGDVVVGGGTIV